MVFCSESRKGDDPPPPITASPNSAACADIADSVPLLSTGESSATEARLCSVVLRLIDGVEPSARCIKAKAILDDVFVFEADDEGNSTYFLAQKSRGKWWFVAELGRAFGGRGNMSGWLDGVRAHVESESNHDISIDYRIQQSDWDVGSGEFSFNSSCRRLWCTRGADGQVSCISSQRLREAGGTYGLVPAVPGPGNWPYKVGAPKNQWDCRTTELVRP